MQEEDLGISEMPFSKIAKFLFAWRHFQIVTDATVKDAPISYSVTFILYLCQVLGLKYFHKVCNNQNCPFWAYARASV